ncbi:MAG: phosphatidate cytidylyltransferase [Bacteroidetes bacterium]|nr:phosphatidate cytidylyltransferase [Bacteroidota bacterium]
MNNLTSRVLVALLGIPALIYIILQGGALFCGLIVIITSIGLWEFYLMAEKKGISANKYVGIFFGAMIPILFFIPSMDKFGLFTSMLNVVFTLLLFVVSTILAEMFRGKPNAFLNITVTIGGVMYVAGFLLCLLGIRTLPSILGVQNLHGGYFILCMFIAIWLCDTTAYFVGKSIGRHKLFERVSPNKTWEGAIAGAVAAVGGFIGVSAWLLPELPMVHSATLGIIVGTIGQAGDLAESLLKRDAGVKDSSNILAGHGGVLDRFDSILMTSPIVYIYIFSIDLLGK